VDDLQQFIASVSTATTSHLPLILWDDFIVSNIDWELTVPTTNSLIATTLCNFTQDHSLTYSIPTLPRYHEVRFCWNTRMLILNILMKCFLMLHRMLLILIHADIDHCWLQWKELFLAVVWISRTLIIYSIQSTGIWQSVKLNFHQYLGVQSPDACILDLLPSRNPIGVHPWVEWLHMTKKLRFNTICHIKEVFTKNNAHYAL